MTDRELINELIKIRFRFMRINSFLASEDRKNHFLIVMEYLLDEEIRRMAPEVND